MKLFNIFDEMGNKIGEIHETENPLDGAGCVLTVIISFIVGMGIIWGWPLFFKQLFYGAKDSEAELYWQILYLCIIIAVLLTRIIVDCRKELFSFGESWGNNLLSVTLIAGIGYSIIASIIEGFSFGLMLGSVFLSFLLSVSSGFVATLLTAVIRWIKRKKG